MPEYLEMTTPERESAVQARVEAMDVVRAKIGWLDALWRGPGLIYGV